MARKFLYFIAIIAVIVIGAGFALSIWSRELTAIALVPTTEFVEQDALADNAYQDPQMWFSRPGIGTSDPARWQPAMRGEGRSIPAPAEQSPPAFAVFFVHPTSYMDRASWNAALDNVEANNRARLYVRGLASPFNQADEIWAPRYRQATVGAFLTDAPEAKQALDAAYADVAQAFAYFRDTVDDDTPIVLAGHSQGALHLLRLLREQVAGQPVADRVSAVYVIGWPISVEHDLPALPFPACATADQPACIMSWSTYAEPADPSDLLETYANSIGFDGKPRGESSLLCSNPLTGGIGGDAPRERNLGTLVPENDLDGGELVPQAVPARCDERGLLLIGEPPELGNYVLPGNNYHVYDIPLFWRNLQADVAARVEAWQKQPAS
ncbi:DUF3089 domain-containing protein [Parerythrobacter aestuarii]|uniref:DUF3089 domain-containing protein n=1 Tax=Parerythrobacter aestuarii TaxID=3020909 RepID=UPI0024DEE030|nr:DUF3089 domain-containing protein [Parerythrobacter aestuarii]